MKGAFTLILVGVVVLVGLVVLSSGFYAVSEYEFVVITQFGELKRAVTEAGLHWKTPFIQDVTRIEKRVLAWDGDPNDIFTEDKKNIFIDTWARWRVVDPEKFYVSLNGRIQGGQKKLDDIVDGVVRDVISGYQLYELVRTTNRKLMYTVEATEFEKRTEQPEVKIGRGNIMQEILQKAGEGARLKERFGIELLDVRIKRVNYVPNVKRSIYDRMNSERERISKRFLSEAEAEQSIILGNMAKELATIEGDAKRQDSEIRGEADALAIKIYADAIRQAPEFYEFMRVLEAYEKIFDGNTRVILSTDSQLLRLLKEDVNRSGK